MKLVYMATRPDGCRAEGRGRAAGGGGGGDGGAGWRWGVAIVGGGDGGWRWGVEMGGGGWGLRRRAHKRRGIQLACSAACSITRSRLRLGVFHTTALAGERSRNALCWRKCSARRSSSRERSSGLMKSTSCTSSSRANASRAGGSRRTMCTSGASVATKYLREPGGGGRGLAGAGGGGELGGGEGRSARRRLARRSLQALRRRRGRGGLRGCLAAASGSAGTGLDGGGVLLQRHGRARRRRKSPCPPRPTGRPAGAARPSR